MNEEKSALEQFQKLHDAMRELFLAICHELKIDLMVKWLDERIRAFRK